MVYLKIIAIRVKTFHFEIQLIIVYLRRDNPSDTPRGTSYVYMLLSFIVKLLRKNVIAYHLVSNYSVFYERNSPSFGQ